MKIITIEERIALVDALKTGVFAIKPRRVLISNDDKNRALLLAGVCKMCGKEPIVLFAPFEIADIHGDVLRLLRNERVEFRISCVSSPYSLITSALDRNDWGRFSKEHKKRVKFEIRTMIENIFAEILNCGVLDDISAGLDDDTVAQLLEHLEHFGVIHCQERN